MKQLTIIGKNPQDTDRKHAALNKLKDADTEALEKLAELAENPKAQKAIVSKFNTIKIALRAI